MASPALLDSSIAPAFSDPRVMLVRTNSEHCGVFWDETQAGFESSEDGPTFIVIGRESTDIQLERLAIRFNSVTLQQLKDFRDTI